MINTLPKSLIEAANLRQQIDINNYVTDTVGLPTLKDIMQELEKPGLDPRGKAEVFSFSETINEIADLKGWSFERAKKVFNRIVFN